MSELRRNKPYKAFDPKTEETVLLMKGSSVNGKNIDGKGQSNIKLEQDSYLVPNDSVITLYDGRYCAVAAFIFAAVNNRICVLANKRGEGTPDFQGCWNCPCGFLERNESGEHGAARETLEECNYIIKPNKLKMVGVQTDPYRSNNGNVTLRYSAIVGNDYGFQKNRLNENGGEENEVTEVKWIPLSEIDNYQWAFGHNETIRKVMPGWLKRMWLLIRYLE